jgi:hypothetical protein
MAKMLPALNVRTGGIAGSDAREKGKATSNVHGELAVP